MTGRLVRQPELPATTRDEMYAMLSTHFDGVSRDRFDADLSQKNWAVLIEDDRGTLVGFSTILSYQATAAGESLNVIYSGDTIVVPHAWGAAALPRMWISAVYELRKHLPPDRRLVWLLLTSGYRTYRFLPVFWNEFYPRPDIVTPRDWQLMCEELASRQFGEQFDRASGIVRFDRPQRLRGTLGEVPAGRADDSYVRFFLSRNPGHIDGDELVCVSDLSETNLSPAGRRVVFGAAR